MWEHPCCQNPAQIRAHIPHTRTLRSFAMHDGKTHNMWCSSRATHLFHRRSQYLGVRPTFGELHVWRAPKFSS